MSTEPTQAELLAEQAALSTKLLERNVRSLREAVSLFDDYIDPREAYMVNGEMWEPMGGGLHGQDPCDMPYRNEGELRIIRSNSRHLCLTNEFAICAIENRISYLVGWGHQYNPAAKPGDELSEADLQAVSEVLDAFCKDNFWGAIRQPEIVRRLDRDGEAFLRFFPQSDGSLKVRFVEPWQVATPPQLSNAANVTFGIEHEPGDVESPIAYWIDGQRVEAQYIQHRKSNVDSNWPRGLPTFFPVRKNLLRAEKHLRNMSAVVGIQAAIAMVRKHVAATQASVQAAVANLASYQSTDSRTGRTKTYQEFAPGTILDVPGTSEYEFPAAGLDVGKVVSAIQAELRAVASRLVMPEFMLTSDASNANYSSTLVAEGPAVKMFQRMQQSMIGYDQQVLMLVLKHAAEGGRIRADLLERVQINAEPPVVQTRDELKEAQVRQIDMANGILSPQTATAESGRNYEDEQANIEDHMERVGASVEPAEPDPAGDGEPEEDDNNEPPQDE